MQVLSFSKFESLQDDMSPEDILEQAQKAAEEAAEKLTIKKPISTVRFFIFFVYFKYCISLCAQ